MLSRIMINEVRIPRFEACFANSKSYHELYVIGRTYVGCGAGGVDLDGVEGGLAGFSDSNTTSG